LIKKKGIVVMEKRREKGQNHWSYELTNIAIDGEGNLRYTTYGVQALDHEGNVAAAYADVSTDRRKVEELVAKCNENDLHILHLEDVALDLIE
jgi:hypothetical protein